MNFKLSVLIIVALAAGQAHASTSVFFPNNNTTQTGTVVSGKNAADVNIIGGTISATNPSVGTNGATAPTSSTEVAGKDGSGNLQPLKVDTSGNLATSRTWTLLNSTDSVNAVQSGTWNLGNITGTITLPTGASTEASLAKLTVTQGSTTAGQSGPLNLGAVTTSAPTYTTGQTSAFSLNTSGGLRVDGSGVTQPVSLSGNQAVNITQVAGASVVTGHGTAAGAIRVELPTDGTGVVSSTQGSPASVANAWPVKNTDGTNVAAVKAASTAPVATDPALVVTVSPNSSAQSTKSPVNTTGSGSASAATVSTVITLTAPANTAGFLLQAIDTNTANVRWSVGRTATPTLGQQLQPGRDTGFVPCGVNVSIVAESGTQTFDIQWVSQ